MESCCKIEHERQRFYEKRVYQIVSLAASFVALILSYLWNDYIIGHDHMSGANAFLMYLNPGWIAVVLCGIPIVVTAFESLFVRKKIKSSLLISTALFACLALEILAWAGVTDGAASHGHSYIFAAGEVAFLMSIGTLLEDITIKKSRAGIEKLLNLAPTTANIDINGQFISMPVDFVQIGDTVLVKPFEQISVDGIVKKGQSAVVTSAITGESLPQDVKEGDAVYAGTWNNNGSLEITVTKLSSDTTVAKMVKLVRQSESQKAPIVSVADKWASIIVPSAIALSAVVFATVLWGFNLGWQTALIRAVTVLVVFCPCALALATPTAIAAAIGNASRRGVLIKSGLALETLAKVDSFVFDKTGTLTESKIQLKEFYTTLKEQEFLSLLASAESDSEHPLAKAVLQYVSGKAEVIKPKNTKSLVGVGVEADIDGQKVIVAKCDYFEDFPFSEQKAQYDQKGYTAIALSLNGKVVGIAGLSDKVKEGAKQCVAGLNELGLTTVMLTGDNAYAAKSVAQETGITCFEANLLPQQKVDYIKALKGEGKKVCLVGDGVNDAPSLASADCSVTMGVMGSDVALEISDIALMTDSIEKLPFLYRLSKKTLFTIIRNISISMAINLASIVLSLLGILNPVWGALIHNASSVLVVFSSSLLLTHKEKKETRLFAEKTK